MRGGERPAVAAAAAAAAARASRWVHGLKSWLEEHLGGFEENMGLRSLVGRGVGWICCMGWKGGGWGSTSFCESTNNILRKASELKRGNLSSLEKGAISFLLKATVSKQVGSNWAWGKTPVYTISKLEGAVLIWIFFLERSGCNGPLRNMYIRELIPGPGVFFFSLFSFASLTKLPMISLS